MSTDYTYDEQGQFFPYFVTTVASLATVPITVSLLWPSKELEDTAPRIKSDFKPEHADLIEGQKRKRRRRERKIKRTIGAITGWIVIAWMVYLMMVTARTTPKLWDPYDVLGISRSASEQEIKSHYRRLSITHHPDKLRPDPAKNETVEDINERWVEMTKAFKSLTDEEVRNNFLKYGNPDGKQSFSVGIALPQFIVTEGNGKYVLLLYGLLLGVLLPYVVGRWWYGSQRVTKEGVLTSTAGHLFKEYDDNITDGAVVTALSAGDEFPEMLKGNRGEAGLDRLENKVLKAGDGQSITSGMNFKDKQRLQAIDDSKRRKALGLLWAYMGRVELQDQSLDDEKYGLAPTALQLLESFNVICLAYSWTKPLLSSYHIHQHLIQALVPGLSPLLQLPYFNAATVRAVEGKNAKNHFSVQTFMQIPEEQRRKHLVVPGLLTQAQYSTAISVASQMPNFKVEKAFFKVVGERFIVPNSLVQFVIKCRFIPPGTRNIPKVNELDLEDVDADEGDLDAIRGKKKPAKTVDGEKAKAGAEKPIQPPLVHAPYLAKEQSPRWHVFLADPKQLKIAVPPFTFTHFEKPLVDEQGKPTFNIQTLKMQFGTPPQPGSYNFVMHLVCDSYVGFDTSFPVTLEVDDPAKAEDIEEEEEISEPEEDSIAGQMNALKTGQTRGGASKRSAEDESDDSDTEGDEDTGSETDTDTDTDTDEE